MASILSTLLENNSNASCFDCNAQQVTSASVNHGIFLCNTCAGMHRALRSEISLVKTLQEGWDLSELQLMMAGGNSAFKQFLQDFPLPYFTISFVYRTRAASYYREKLKSVAHGYLFDAPPPTSSQGIQTVEEFRENHYFASLLRNAKEIRNTISSKISEFSSYNYTNRGVKEVRYKSNCQQETIENL